MIFVFFFGSLMIVLLIIGFYPAIKRNIFEGNVFQNISSLFLWLISCSLGIFTFFRLRIIYTPIREVSEEFWQAMTIVDNLITGFIFIMAVIFCMMVYGHYQNRIKIKFLYLTSLQFLILCIQSVIHYTVKYFLTTWYHFEVDFFVFFFWILLTIFSFYIYFNISKIAEYGFEEFFQDLYE